MRGEDDVLQEEAAIEPAMLGERPMDGEDQTDGRVEEDIVAAGLPVTRRLVGAIDTECGVVALAKIAGPAPRNPAAWGPERVRTWTRRRPCARAESLRRSRVWLCLSGHA